MFVIPGSPIRKLLFDDTSKRSQELNERTQANDALVDSVSSSNPDGLSKTEKYVEHQESGVSLDYCQDWLLALARLPPDGMNPDWGTEEEQQAMFLDGYNQDGPVDKKLYITETAIINDMSKFINKLDETYYNNKNYKTVDENFTYKYENIKSLFNMFQKINSKTVQTKGITCNIQNYVNRCSLAFPLSILILGELPYLRNGDGELQICFSSQEESDKLVDLYNSLRGNVMKSIGLVHKTLEQNKLENLAFEEGDEEDIKNDKLKKKTELLSKISMEAPIAMGIYASFSAAPGFSNMLKKQPYEVGGAYIATNRKILLTPAIEPELQCEINADNIYSPDPGEENVYYLTGDDEIDSEINNWTLNASARGDSEVIQQALDDAEISDEVADEGNYKLRVTIDQYRAYTQEKGWPSFLYSIGGHFYGDGRPVININQAFM